LKEIDIGDDKTSRPTFVNKTLEADSRDEMIDLLKEILIALLGVTPRCQG
jgi:hypothetical protein